MKGLLRKLCVFIIAVLFICTMPTNMGVFAASKKVESGDLFDVSGKYVYYSKNMEGTRTGLIRYDAETGEKKELYSYMYKGDVTNGFSNIISKGNYIYAIWDFYGGSYTSDPYIYRFNKDGFGKKKLAFSDEFYIKGSKIYYEKVKWMEKGTVSAYTTPTGYYSMNLDGSGKKKISGSTWKKIKKQSETYCLYENFPRQKNTVKKTTWEYHADGREIWRVKRSNGERQRLYFAEAHDVPIVYAETHGDWIIFELNETSYGISQPSASIYLLSTDGTREYHLKTWDLGE